jgi:hypothetical protein
VWYRGAILLAEMRGVVVWIGADDGWCESDLHVAQFF